MKFPKKIGKVSDMLFTKKEELAAANKVVALLKAQKSEIENHIINTFPKEDIEGALGEFSKTEIKEKDCYSITDHVKFRKYMEKHDAWDMLQKRLGDTAISLRLKEGKKLPFVSVFTKKVVSCTKR